MRLFSNRSQRTSKCGKNRCTATWNLDTLLLIRSEKKDSMSLWVCTVIDHRDIKNLVRTSARYRYLHQLHMALFALITF